MTLIQRRKKTMRALRFSVLAVAILLMLGALQARADSDSDDLTVCCAQANNKNNRSAAFAVNPVAPIVLGCKAIDASPKSIGSCSGVVLGCAEAPFLCQPSTQYPGLMDCFCRTRALLGMTY
jgi:hypothetical protein